jgi:hypothetical protein
VKLRAAQNKINYPISSPPEQLSISEEEMCSTEADNTIFYRTCHTIDLTEAFELPVLAATHSTAFSDCGMQFTPVRIRYYNH